MPLYIGRSSCNLTGDTMSETSVFRTKRKESDNQSQLDTFTEDEEPFVDPQVNEEEASAAEDMLMSVLKGMDVPEERLTELKEYTAQYSALMSSAAYLFESPTTATEMKAVLAQFFINIEKATLVLREREFLDKLPDKLKEILSAPAELPPAYSSEDETDDHMFG